MFFLNLLLFNNKIRVKKDNVFHLSYENYEKNFIFVVNGEKFQTSRIIADILSPKINNLHLSEPKTNKYTINTENPGNFSIFLQLINFNFNEIPEKEIPFINEITAILGTQFIEITQEEDEEELTINNSFKKLKKHEKYKNVYSKQIEKEVDFIATHFYMIDINDTSIYSLKKFVIDQIFNHTQLSLKNEDQLLTIVNNFYINNSNYSYMYEYVEFNEVSNQCFSSFLKIYNYSDLTQKVWSLISNRLEQNQENEELNKKHQYFGQLFPYHNNSNDFNGIINFLRKSSKGITGEVSLSYSSIQYDMDGTSHSIFNFEDTKRNFYTNKLNNSWICINFLNHSIIPLNYTIKIFNHSNVDNLKNWVIEGSVDGDNWFLVDEQNDFEKFEVHTFQIEPIPKRMKYFRIRMTGNSWQGRGCLEINAIEIYGYLI